MSPKSLVDIILEIQQCISPILPNATVYADKHFSEFLNWSWPGGFENLIEIGVWNIKDLDEALSGAQEVESIMDSKKLVILTTQMIPSLVMKISSLLSSNLYTECFIVTCFPEHNHLQEYILDEQLQSRLRFPLNQDKNIFKHCEKVLISILEQTAYQVQGTIKVKHLVGIKYFPMNFCLFAPDVFLIPSCQDLFPSTAPVASNPGAGGTSDHHHTGRACISPEAKLLAKHINSILEAMSLNDEIFAMGDCSKSVARATVSSIESNANRKGAERHIGVVLMDRTLDLVAPLLHDDNLLSTLHEQYISAFPCSLDLLSSPNECHENIVSLAHQFDKRQLGVLEYLVSQSFEDSVALLRSESAENHDAGYEKNILALVTENIEEIGKNTIETVSYEKEFLSMTLYSPAIPKLLQQVQDLILDLPEYDRLKLLVMICSIAGSLQNWDAKCAIDLERIFMNEEYKHKSPRQEKLNFNYNNEVPISEPPQQIPSSPMYHDHYERKSVATQPVNQNTNGWRNFNDWEEEENFQETKLEQEKTDNRLSFLRHVDNVQTNFAQSEKAGDAVGWEQDIDFAELNSPESQQEENIAAILQSENSNIHHESSLQLSIIAPVPTIKKTTSVVEPESSWDIEIQLDHENVETHNQLSDNISSTVPNNEEPSFIDESEDKEIDFVLSDPFTQQASSIIPSTLKMKEESVDLAHPATVQNMTSSSVWDIDIPLDNILQSELVENELHPQFHDNKFNSLTNEEADVQQHLVGPSTNAVYGWDSFVEFQEEKPALSNHDDLSYRNENNTTSSNTVTSTNIFQHGDSLQVANIPNNTTSDVVTEDLHSHRPLGDQSEALASSWDFDIPIDEEVNIQADEVPNGDILNEQMKSMTVETQNDIPSTHEKPRHNYDPQPEQTISFFSFIQNVANEVVQLVQQEQSWGDDEIDNENKKVPNAQESMQSIATEDSTFLFTDTKQAPRAEAWSGIDLHLDKDNRENESAGNKLENNEKTPISVSSIEALAIPIAVQHDPKPDPHPDAWGNRDLELPESPNALEQTAELPLPPTENIVDNIKTDGTDLEFLTYTHFRSTGVNDALIDNTYSSNLNPRIEENVHIYQDDSESYGTQATSKIENETSSHENSNRGNMDIEFSSPENQHIKTVPINQPVFQGKSSFGDFQHISDIRADLTQSLPIVDGWDTFELPLKTDVVSVIDPKSGTKEQQQSSENSTSINDSLVPKAESYSVDPVNENRTQSDAAINYVASITSDTHNHASEDFEADWGLDHEEQSQSTNIHTGQKNQVTIPTTTDIIVNQVKNVSLEEPDIQNQTQKIVQISSGNITQQWDNLDIELSPLQAYEVPPSKLTANGNTATSPKIAHSQVNAIIHEEKKECENGYKFEQVPQQWGDLEVELSPKQQQQEIAPISHSETVYQKSKELPLNLETHSSQDHVLDQQQRGDLEVELSPQQVEKTFSLPHSVPAHDGVGNVQVVANESPQETQPFSTQVYEEHSQRKVDGLLESDTIPVNENDPNTQKIMTAEELLKGKIEKFSRPNICFEDNFTRSKDQYQAWGELEIELSPVKTDAPFINESKTAISANEDFKIPTSTVAVVDSAPLLSNNEIHGVQLFEWTTGSNKKRPKNEQALIPTSFKENQSQEITPGAELIKNDFGPKRLPSMAVLQKELWEDLNMYMDIPTVDKHERSFDKNASKQPELNEELVADKIENFAESTIPNPNVSSFTLHHFTNNMLSTASPQRWGDLEIEFSPTEAIDSFIANNPDSNNCITQISDTNGDENELKNTGEPALHQTGNLPVDTDKLSEKMDYTASIVGGYSDTQPNLANIVVMENSENLNIHSELHQDNVATINEILQNYENHPVIDNISTNNDKRTEISATKSNVDDGWGNLDLTPVEPISNLSLPLAVSDHLPLTTTDNNTYNWNTVENMNTDEVEGLELLKNSTDESKQASDEQTVEVMKASPYEFMISPEHISSANSSHRPSVYLNYSSNPSSPVVETNPAVAGNVDHFNTWNENRPTSSDYFCATPDPPLVQDIIPKTSQEEGGNLASSNKSVSNLLNVASIETNNVELKSMALNQNQSAWDFQISPIDATIPSDNIVTQTSVHSNFFSNKQERPLQQQQPAFAPKSIRTSISSNKAPEVVSPSHQFTLFAELGAAEQSIKSSINTYIKLDQDVVNKKDPQISNIAKTTNEGWGMDDLDLELTPVEEKDKLPDAPPREEHHHPRHSFTDKTKSISVDKFLETVQFLFGTRRHMKILKCLNAKANPVEYEPLVKGILLDVADEKTVRNEAESDYVHIPAGGTFGSVLSGFSRFLGGPKPHPSHYQTLMIFVIGGITFEEIRIMRETAQAHNIRLCIGSTHFATSNFIMRSLFS